MAALIHVHLKILLRVISHHLQELTVLPLQIRCYISFPVDSSTHFYILFSVPLCLSFLLTLQLLNSNQLPGLGWYCEVSLKKIIYLL